ncbi:MAG: hypothetical protein M1281_20495 [Chloroflexi bacterium]|nr:hypothetical protein [Chloroflexota bacterium]
MRITQDKPAHPPKKVSEQLSLALAGLLVVLGLSLASLYSILLFHSLAEIFFVVVAFSILIIAWNSRPFMENSFLTFIGVAYLFIGLLVLAHLLRSEERRVMPPTTPPPSFGSDLATFWL